MWYIYMTLAIMLIAFLYALGVYTFTAASEAFKQYLLAEGYKDAGLWLLITAVCSAVSFTAIGGATTLVILIISTWRW